MTHARFHSLDRADIPLEVDYQRDGDLIRAEINNGDAVTQVHGHVRGARVSLSIGMERKTAYVQATSSGYHVHIGGRVICLDLITAAAFQRRMVSEEDVDSNSNEVFSPMAGKVVAVQVEQGVRVAAGDTLLILEAMKMENEIKASRAATIADVHVTADDTVEVGASLVRFEEDA